MLQIRHICKEYRTGKLVQKALDDVSLNLRDNEFVAILGPSGSGKTTLLNIIGAVSYTHLIHRGKMVREMKIPQVASQSKHRTEPAVQNKMEPAMRHRTVPVIQHRILQT